VQKKSEVKPRSLILLAKPPLSRCPTSRGNATFEIMPSANLDALHEIKAAHPPRTGWWFYPSEEKTNVQGFLGTGKIFILGIRPSNDDWNEDHQNRRAFYDVLASEVAGNCHLTDFFKRRAPAGERPERISLEMDFHEHLDVLAKEVELLQPSIILAMGRADDLLRKHTNFGIRIKKIIHFGAVYWGKGKEFEASLRRALKEARAAGKQRALEHQRPATRG
jgi:hypothetical protein